MKKTIQIAVAGMALLFAAQLTSCTKDKDDDTSIVGTWQSKSLYYSIKENGTLTEESTETNTGVTVVIKDDKTFTNTDANYPSHNSNGTYATEGSKLYLNNSDGTKDTMDFTVNKTELTLSNNGTYVMDTVNYEYVQRSTFTRK